MFVWCTYVITIKDEIPADHRCLMMIQLPGTVLGYRYQWNFNIVIIILLTNVNKMYQSLFRPLFSFLCYMNSHWGYSVPSKVSIQPKDRPLDWKTLVGWFVSTHVTVKTSKTNALKQQRYLNQQMFTLMLLFYVLW